MKSANPTLPASPSGLKTWILSARPKTLIAGICPVLVGSCLAAHYDGYQRWIALLCLLFSVSLQIGTNWANDYFDYCKGADTFERKGPPRGVQSGWISPLAMRNAAMAAFLCAAFIAVPLILRIGIGFTPLMLLCILCGILYTGGKKPLGYLGLGDLLVLVFYGPVATCCTVYAHLMLVPSDAWLASLPPGLLCCALLCINNLRDVAEDRKAGKMTLVARFGERFGQWEYLLILFAVQYVSLLIHPLFLLLLPLLIQAGRKCVMFADAFTLILQLLVLYTVFYAIFSL
jgi:1,4-dihydroxy-2-naphthoate polyprenyltransferase